MIDFKPPDTDVMEAVRLLRFARNALHAATLKLDDAGYTCAALDHLYCDCAGLVADWAGRRPQPVPEHMVRAAVEYRHRHGRSY
ncbi:hypothetical protein NKH19_00735 [Mesorhizobium sp. M1338]|uniref:hypothetical protein n=1 Tax=unclassified Mesorhizobium TaxID=325217 RepID=UPI00333A77DA